MNTSNSLYSNTLNINGSEIVAKVVKQNVYAFGPDGHHTTVKGPQTIGFINALADVMDQQYAICIPGFHSHVGFDTLPLEGPKQEGRAFVNFDMLTDENVIKWLASFGIEKIPGKVGWLVLDTVWGRFVPAWYAAPKTTLELLMPKLPENYAELSDDEQKAARNAARALIHPRIFSDNEHAWSIIHKHNGVSLVLMIMRGTTQVVCMPDRDGLEWQSKVFLNKFQLLFGSSEARHEAKAATTAKNKAQRGADTGAFYVRKYSEYEQRADEIIQEEGLIVLNGDAAVEMSAADLVRKRVAYFSGEQRTAIVFLPDMAAVKAAVIFTKSNNLTIGLL